MTAQELLEASFAILGKDTTDTADSATAALIYINALLAELYDIQNAILENGEETLLTSIPELALAQGEDLGDLTIPYKDVLARNVMPWGLARLFALAESNPNLGYINNTYEENKNKTTPTLEGDITDVYADNDD